MHKGQAIGRNVAYWETKGRVGCSRGIACSRERETFYNLYGTHSLAKVWHIAATTLVQWSLGNQLHWATRCTVEQVICPGYVCSEIDSLSSSYFFLLGLSPSFPREMRTDLLTLRGRDVFHSLFQLVRHELDIQKNVQNSPLFQIQLMHLLIHMLPPGVGGLGGTSVFHSGVPHIFSSWSVSFHLSFWRKDPSPSGIREQQISPNHLLMICLQMSLMLCNCSFMYVVIHPSIH